MSVSLYAIALGSNRSSRFGAPAMAIDAALDALAESDAVLTRSAIRTTPALGPARRRFANAAAIIETDRAPPALLARLKAIERRFGRRPGQRWGDRVIDLDILLRSGGRWASRTLTIPHIHLANRRFVLDPLAEIAADWRIPRTGIRVRHARARLTRRGPSA